MALLLKAPILDDFSKISNSFVEQLKSVDYNLLNKYVKKFNTKRGILLERILYGIVAKK